MTNKQLNDHLDKLDQIQHLDPPPYLFTRIQQKIQTSEDNKFSTKISRALAFSFFFILILNLYMITSIETRSVTVNNSEDTFNLLPHNNLY